MTARQLYRADQRNMLLQARTEGVQQASLDIAGVLLARGMSVEEVADATSLPLAAVRQLVAGKKPGTVKRARATKAR